MIQNPEAALIKYETVIKLEQLVAKNFTFNSTTSFVLLTMKLGLLNWTQDALKKLLA